jgi:hypothetical protein
VKMLFDPLKKQLHLPSVFIKQCYVFCSDFKVVSKIGESSFLFHRVVNNTSERARVFLCSLWSCKPYRLIVKNIIRTFKKIFAINDFILKMPSFPYYEVGADKIDSKKSCKIKIASVENIVSIRFIGNFIHGIHIIDFDFSNMKKCWDLGNNIVQSMYLDPAFGLVKTRPPKKIKAQIYGGRIKGIKSTCNYKFPCNTER